MWAQQVSGYLRVDSEVFIYYLKISSQLQEKQVRQSSSLWTPSLHIIHGKMEQTFKKIKSFSFFPFSLTTKTYRKEPIIGSLFFTSFSVRCGQLEHQDCRNQLAFKSLSVTWNRKNNQQVCDLHFFVYCWRAPVLNKFSFDCKHLLTLENCEYF